MPVLCQICRTTVLPNERKTQLKKNVRLERVEEVIVI